MSLRHAPMPDRPASDDRPHHARAHVPGHAAIQIETSEDTICPLAPSQVV